MVAMALLWRGKEMTRPNAPGRLAAFALTIACAATVPAAAQTWTGSASGAWNDANNWSTGPLFLPSSSQDTALIFGRPGVTKNLTQNLTPNPFVLNSLTFTLFASGY